MDFRLDDEQLALWDTVRRLCTDRFGHGELGRREDGRVDHGAWRALADPGFGAVRSPGLANVTWLSDFPHPTSTFPTSWEYIERSLADCTPEERRMILVETPRRLYHLPEGY